MTGAVAYAPWMDKSAVGVLWQGDANFAHTCKKIEIRFDVGNLMPSEGQFAWKRFLRTHFCLSSAVFQQVETRYYFFKASSPGPSPPNLTFWTLWDSAAITVKMIHNTLKSTQPSEHSPRTTSAAQRKLWRYSRCRGASQVESHRHSVCVLAADLNAGGGGGGGGVMHTIHGLCHLCIGCRLPQVCLR